MRSHGDHGSGFRVELLGPVEARMDGAPVPLGGPRPRALFAILALADGRVLSYDELMEALWGADVPARGRDGLQMHMSRLRKSLADAGAADGRLCTTAGGYALQLRPGESDLDSWRQALESARRARVGGDLEAARMAIDDALAVWRGRPLAGTVETDLVTAEQARLEEERLAAIVEGVELDLELGRHAEVLGTLEALVTAHPFMERLVELHMLALYRSGRQADALTAFRAARRRFVDELGIEPAQTLRTLHEDVLKHAPELMPSGAAGDMTAAGRSPPAAAGVLHVLPPPPNRTIGREGEIGAIVKRVRGGATRLLTLTGPGGVGKTRLALESARTVQADFVEGAHFVPLGALRRPEELAGALVETLEIVALRGESAEHAVERFLARKHLLLLLDNAEQLLAAAPFVARLLETCPSLSVLATSREPFALQAEERFPVSPLALPEAGATHSGEVSAAVALFCERARAQEPAFALTDSNAGAVTDICRRVDGLPLAIELAAARCALLTPAEIAARLETALDALGTGPRDAPARQRTLRATVEWSYELLDEEERRCFERCAVFAGGATIDAAETVTGAALRTLERLVAKSLLVRENRDPGATRLRLLETIRAYATERLDASGDAAEVRREHFRYYLELARREGSERLLRRAAAREHLTRLDAEIHNLHAALRWALDQPSAEPALAMTVAMGAYWTMRERYADAVRWIDQALNLPGTDAHPHLRVRGLCMKAQLLWPLGRAAERPATLAAAEAIARPLRDPALLSQVFRSRAEHEIDAERLELAGALADEALANATAAGDAWEIAEAAGTRAIAASELADLRRRVDHAAAQLTAVGNVHALATLLSSAAYAALCLGSPPTP